MLTAQARDLNTPCIVENDIPRRDRLLHEGPGSAQVIAGVGEQCGQVDKPRMRLQKTAVWRPQCGRQRVRFELLPGIWVGTATSATLPETDLFSRTEQAQHGQRMPDNDSQCVFEPAPGLLGAREPRGRLRRVIEADTCQRIDESRRDHRGAVPMPVVNHDDTAPARAQRIGEQRAGKALAHNQNLCIDLSHPRILRSQRGVAKHPSTHLDQVRAGWLIP